MRTEAPGLKENFKIESSLIWHPLEDTGRCLAEWKVSVTNESKSTVTIRKVLRRAWLIDRTEPQSPLIGIKSYDAMNAARAKSNRSDDPMEPYIEDKENKEKNGPFVQTYPPEGGADYAFEWFVEKRPKAYMVVRLDFYGDDVPVYWLWPWGKKKPNLLDFRYDWGPSDCKPGDPTRIEIVR